MLQLELLCPEGHVSSDDRQARCELFTLFIWVETLFEAPNCFLMQGDPILEAAESVGLGSVGAAEEVLDTSAREGLLFFTRTGGRIPGFGGVQPGKRIVRRAKLLAEGVNLLGEFFDGFPASRPDGFHGGELAA